jgi:hypothetical protein
MAWRLVSDNTIHDRCIAVGGWRVAIQQTIDVWWIATIVKQMAAI